MKKLFFVLAAACSFGFSKAQIVTDSLKIAGNYRTFHFERPEHSRPGASLVFAMHGSGGNGLGARRDAAGLQQLADKENIVVVYPDGYKRFWNECRKAATSKANIENIDEQAFFAAMIAHFKTKYKIDDKRVFAVGMSGGGHMAYKLALTMPDKFRAITAIIANLPSDDNMDCAPAGKALPVMIINGTADPLNPYNGGEMRTGDTYLGRVRSTDDTFRYWSALAGYTGSPVKTDLPDTDPSDGKTIERYRFHETGKPEVVLLKVINGKHDYPRDIDPYVEAWSFFKRQLQE